MRLPLLCLLLTAHHLVHAYEPNLNCISGPSYWCKSIQNAKECGAYKHCTQTVWTKHDKYLKINEKNFYETSSSLSSTPNKCTNCMQCLSTDLRRCAYVNLYKEEVSELLLVSKLSPVAICGLLRQCDLPDQTPHQLVEQEQLVDHSKSLENDENTVDDFLIRNDKRFKCGMHPRNWCDSLKITRRCHAFDYCLAGWSKSTVKYTSKPLTTADSSLLSKEELASQKACGFCIFVFNKLQSVMQQNATQVEVKEYLEGACSLLPSQSEVNECMSLINAYYTEIYNMVRNNIDPGIICRVLRACKDQFLIPVETSTSSPSSPSSSDSASDMEKLVANLKQAKFKVLNENEAIIKTPLQQQNTNKALLAKLGSRAPNSITQLKKTWGVGCELCTIVLNAAKYLLENKMEDEKILSFIETQLCARLGEYNQTCVAYVSEEGEIVLDMLAKSVDPALICRGMGLCLKVQVSDEFVNEKFFDLQVRNPLNCTLCKLVITQVKQMLMDNKKQAEILNYIDTNLCAKVGKTKELCKSLIDAYGPLFLEIIARDVNPAQLCSMLGMCESSTIQTISIGFIDLEESKPLVPLTREVASQTSANQTCVLCEFVLNVLTRYISQNSTEPEIEKWLEQVCTVFPSSLKSECDSFVHQYGPIIVALLVKEVQPDKVCTALSLCPKRQSHLAQMMISYTDQVNLYKHDNNNNNNNGHDLECTVCQFTIEYLYHQYNIEQTEKNIEFAVNNVCKLTPVGYRSVCESMVGKYGMALIDFLKKYSDSLTVCKEIKMCKANVIYNKQQRHTESSSSSSSLVDLMPAQVIKQRKVFFENDANNNVKNGSIECSLCMYAAQMVASKLKENKTEEEIVAELKMVCNLFPKKLEDQCSSFIEEYGPYICQLVAQDLDPQSTCSALKLCDAAIPEATLKRLYDNFHY